MGLSGLRSKKRLVRPEPVRKVLSHEESLDLYLDNLEEFHKETTQKFWAPVCIDNQYSIQAVGDFNEKREDVRYIVFQDKYDNRLSPELYHNIEFIALAHQATPALVSEIRKLREEVKRLKRSNAMACENPKDDCECPGCFLVWCDNFDRDPEDADSLDHFSDYVSGVIR